MNRIIFIIIWGMFAGIFTACEEEHPGYLFSEEAAYPVDSIVVYSPAAQRQVIAGMQATKENFESTEEGRKLYQQKEQLEAKAQEYDEQLEEETFKLWDIEDQLYAYEEGSPEYEELLAQYDEQAEVCNSIERLKNDILFKQVKEVDKQIEAAIGNIDSEIVLLQRRLDNQVAYSTSVIDKMQGTDPLIYSIAGIKAVGGGDADKIAGYLSVMGGGRFLISWDEHIPVGRYVISLYVENEGWKKLLPEIFTVIVK